MLRDHVLCLAVSVLSLVGYSTSQSHLETRSGYGTYAATSGVAVADFNRDGKMDLAVTSYEGNYQVQIFLGRGDGTFESAASYAPGTDATSLAIADLNHDGNPDLVVVNQAANSVVVLLGNGDGTFQSPVSYATPAGPAYVALGDFNGDGNLDIATTNQYANPSSVSVLLGNGDGTFRVPAISTPLPSNAFAEALAAGYLDGAGNLSLAVAANANNTGEVQILLGDGDGTFRLGASYVLGGPYPESIVAADLRNNGMTDLAVAEFEGMGVAVLLGNGDGTFEQPVVYDVGTSLGVAVGDMNGDGIPDLVALSANPGAVYTFLGNGDGTFGSPEISYPTGTFPRALALADFNGDHKLDVTVADQGEDREFVLINTGTATFSPSAPLNFGNQKHGTTSAAKTVTLTNTGKTALKIHSIKATGQFGVTSTCGASVPANASCSVSVTFSPTSAGGKLGTIEVNDSASSKPQAIALSGTGT